MSRAKWMLAAVLVAGSVWASGCSPEATRTRGGGPGADIGNHGQPVQMHGRTNPGYHTPLVGQAVRK